MKIYTECPHCYEEIGIQKEGDLQIGEEGDTICPSCGNQFHYEIAVIKEVQARTT